MDPLSITLSCISLLKTLASVSETLYKFIKNFRGARVELGAIDEELATLRRIVELIQHDCETHKRDDAAAFPGAVQAQLTIVLNNCRVVIEDLAKLLEKHSTSKLGVGGFWATSGKKDAAKIQSTLTTHTGALNLALSLLEMQVIPNTSLKLVLTHGSQFHHETSRCYNPKDRSDCRAS
jgi:hypothetical protein